MTPPIARRLKIDTRKLPAQVFDRCVARAGSIHHRAGREQKAWDSFGKPGRDPNRLNGVMAVVARHGQWMPHLKIAQLRNHWDQVVGPAIAQHSRVADCTDGVLTICTESPVWTTQLTYLVPQLTDTIRKRLDGLTINEIKVTGPQARGFSRTSMRRRRNY